MDNLTHSLFGLTLAQTPIGRRTRGATLALVLASNAPDIDVISTAGGALRYLEWHRSLTHGPLGIVGLGVATAGLVYAGVRRQSDGQSSFLALAGVSMLAVALHIAMDLPTSYGTRLFSPFDWRWFTTDSMPIVDLYLLLALAGGLYAGWRWPRARHASALIVLALMMVNYGIRAIAHRAAVGMTAVAFNPPLPATCADAHVQGRWLEHWPVGDAGPVAAPRPPCVLEVAAMPSFISPFAWRLIARTSDGYALSDVQVLNAFGGARPTSVPPSIHYPDTWTPSTAAAASTDAARIFLGFSRFPAAQVYQTADGGLTVHFTDLRFVGAGPPRSDRPRGDGTGPNARSLFAFTARFTPDLRLIETHLGP